jgi:hypothetical protein
MLLLEESIESERPNNRNGERCAYTQVSLILPNAFSTRLSEKRDPRMLSSCFNQAVSIGSTEETHNCPSEDSNEL